MGRRGIRRSRFLLPLALPSLALLPGLARADTHVFLNTEHLYPSQGGSTYGPANHYPSSMQVSGLSGTVSTATVTLISSSSASPDDLDLVITGPNGQQVMLMSDACGVNPATMDPSGPDTFTFDDSAATSYPMADRAAPTKSSATSRPTTLGRPPNLTTSAREARARRPPT